MGKERDPSKIHAAATSSYEIAVDLARSESTMSMGFYVRFYNYFVSGFPFSYVKFGEL